MTSLSVALLLPPHGDELASSSLRPVVVSWEGTADSYPATTPRACSWNWPLFTASLPPLPCSALTARALLLWSCLCPSPLSLYPRAHSPLCIVSTVKTLGEKVSVFISSQIRRKKMAIIMNICSWLSLNNPHLYTNTVSKWNFFCKEFFLSLYWICSSVSCFVFYPWDLWDLSFLARDLTYILCIGRWSLNQWTAREVLPRVTFLKKKIIFNWWWLT